MDRRDQLAVYRARHREALERKTREKYLAEKYRSLIELDPIRRAVARIVGGVRRRLLREPINASGDGVGIPGLFRLRLRMTELNVLPLGVQRQVIRDLGVGPADADWIQDSYPEVGWVLLDLRVYGPCPEMGVYVEGLGQEVFPSDRQIKRIRDVWAKIDPESNNGIRFRQMLDSSRALGEIYRCLGPGKG